VTTTNLTSADIRNCISISPLSDIHLKKNDRLIIVCNPNNVIVSSSNEASAIIPTNIPEVVQSLCFHSALRNIPIVIINPNLMATAWNDYGAREPSLLKDLAQVYSISDEYYMFGKDSFCGLIQRA
jgi:hypothetical protein